METGGTGENYKRTKLVTDDQTGDDTTQTFEAMIERLQRDALWRYYLEYKEKVDELLLRLKRLDTDFQALSISERTYHSFTRHLFDVLKIQVSPSADFDELTAAINFSGKVIDSETVLGAFHSAKSHAEMSFYKEKLSEEVEKSKLLEQNLARIERSLRRMQTKSVPLFMRDKEEPSEIQENCPVQPDNELKTEIINLRLLCDKRSKELETVSNQKASLMAETVHLKEMISRVPEDVFRDARGVRDLTVEIARLRDQFPKFRKDLDRLELFQRDESSRKRELIKELFEKLSSDRLMANSFVEGLESEINRLRMDRDSMRELYEQANYQLSNMNKAYQALKTSFTNFEQNQRGMKNVTESFTMYSKLLTDLFNNSSLKDAPEMDKLLRTSQEHESILISEIENLNSAYEEVRVQHNELLKTISEKDESSAKLLREKLKAEFNQAQSKKEAEAALSKAEILERGALGRLAAVEESMKTLLNQLSELESKYGLLQVDAQRHKLDFFSKVEEIQSLKARLEKLGSSNVSERLSLMASELESCQAERNRALDELSIIRKGHSTGSSFSQDLQAQLDIYKKLMKCNSCHVRDKNAIIVKCMHVFCKTCLDSRIETRQRKCPNCGEPFGANDIKPIYL